MDNATRDFLSDVQYLTKEEYLKEMNALRKQWKRIYGKISKEIRSLKSQEGFIGRTAISTGYQYLNENINWMSQTEIEDLKEENRSFEKIAGVVQSTRANLSKYATALLDQYMFDKTYLKQCAHYSYVMDRILEDTNHRFV